MNRHGPIENGMPYHVFNRGNDRQMIFLKDDDYYFFLTQVRKYAAAYKITVIAYTLMPNHYHLVVVQQPKGDLPAMMDVLGSTVARRFNKLNGRTGHLFECPYRSVPAESDEGLLHVSRYVHLNPVLAGLVSDPARWRFSSYRDLLAPPGRATAAPLADARLLIAAAGGMERYLAFVKQFRQTQLELLEGLMLEPDPETTKARSIRANASEPSAQSDKPAPEPPGTGGKRYPPQSRRLNRLIAGKTAGP